MKSFVAILLLLAGASCTPERPKTFTVTIPHYQTRITFDRMHDYDTLLVWNWYNDNPSSHRRCYRIQNAALGIALEEGMLPKRAPRFEQMTIQTPLGSNRFPSQTIGEWLRANKENYLSERPGDTIFRCDSISIDHKKFGVFGIERKSLDTKVIFMTTLNHETIEFEFSTNQKPAERFFSESLKMMNTIRFKPDH